MPAEGGYILYRFTAPYSGDYAFTLNFPNPAPPTNDLDLFVSFPNVALDIPTIVEWEDTADLVGWPSPSVEYMGASDGLESFIGTLQAGALYQIMVYTYVAEGPSNYDLTVNFLPPPPSFPPSVRAVARDASAQVTWDRPNYIGSSPLSYLVTTYANDNGAVPGPASVSGATSVLITGLTNTKSYYFQVQTRVILPTGEFLSDFSSNSNPVVPSSSPRVPFPPTNVVASPGDTTASVEWEMSSTTGVSGYIVTAFLNGITGNAGHTGRVSGPTATSAGVTGLTNGSSYKFNVVATNRTGNSIPSSFSNAIIPRAITTPGAPVIRSVVPTFGQIDIAWTPSGLTGGAPIDSYTVLTVSQQGDSIPNLTISNESGDVRSYSMTGGVPGFVSGHTYTFTMRQSNTLYTSASSAGVTAQYTNSGGPSIVANLSAVPGSGTVTLLWGEPSYTGAGIDHYNIYSANNTVSPIATTSSLTYTVIGVSNNVPIRFYVGAVDMEGSEGILSLSNQVIPVANTVLELNQLYNTSISTDGYPLTGTFTAPENTYYTLYFNGFNPLNAGFVFISPPDSTLDGEAIFSYFKSDSPLFRDVDAFASSQYTSYWFGPSAVTFYAEAGSTYDIILSLQAVSTGNDAPTLNWYITPYSPGLAYAGFILDQSSSTDPVLYNPVGVPDQSIITSEGIPQEYAGIIVNPGSGHDLFAVLMDGYYCAPITGTYKFVVESTQGFQLDIIDEVSNGTVRVLDNPGSETSGSGTSDPVVFNAGKYYPFTALWSHAYDIYGLQVTDVLVDAGEGFQSITSTYPFLGSLFKRGELTINYPIALVLDDQVTRDDIVVQVGTETLTPYAPLNQYYFTPNTYYHLYRFSDPNNTGTQEYSVHLSDIVGPTGPGGDPGTPAGRHDVYVLNTSDIIDRANIVVAINDQFAGNGSTPPTGFQSVGWGQNAVVPFTLSSSTEYATILVLAYKPGRYTIEVPTPT
jgi:hypothetical protein